MLRWWYWIPLCHLFFPPTRQFSAKDCAPEGFLEEYGVNLVHMGLRIIGDEWKAFMIYKGVMYTKSLNDAFGYEISPNHSQIFVGAWVAKRYQVFHLKEDIEYYFCGRNFYLPNDGKTLKVTVDYRNTKTKFGFGAATFYERFRITSDAPYDRLTCKYYFPSNFPDHFCETRCQLLGANDGKESYNDCVHDLLNDDYTAVANYSSKIWKGFTAYYYNILQEKVPHAPRYDHTTLRHWYMKFPPDKINGYLELVPDNCYYVHGVAYQIIREEWMNGSRSVINSTIGPIYFPVYPPSTTSTTTTTTTRTTTTTAATTTRSAPNMTTPDRISTKRTNFTRIVIGARITPPRVTPIANVDGPLSERVTITIIGLILLAGVFITTWVQFLSKPNGKTPESSKETVKRSEII